MKALQLEIFKARRKHFGLIVFLIEGVQILWVLWSFRNPDVHDLSQGYLGFFYQLPLLNCIILPILVSVIVSRSCDLEHRENMFKELFTMQKPDSLFNAKLVFTSVYLVVILVVQMLAILVIGHIKGFLDTPFVSDFVFYFLSQFFVSLFLALLIQILALRFVNQFVPIIAGLIAGFLGLMSMFFPPWVMRLVPSAYYGLLSTVHMDWNTTTRIVNYFHAPFSLVDFSVLLLVLILLYLFGRNHFTHREA